MATSSPRSYERTYLPPSGALEISNDLRGLEEAWERKWERPERLGGEAWERPGKILREA